MIKEKIKSYYFYKHKPDFLRILKISGLLVDIRIVISVLIIVVIILNNK